MPRKLREDVPVMNAGSGQIAGIGVGPQGEPGVDLSRRKKKSKSDASPTMTEYSEDPLLPAEDDEDEPSIELTAEDLRKWFGVGKTGGVGGGGWDRYNTKGERIGKCGDAEDRGGEGEGKPKCLSKEKATQLRAQGGKQAIANAVKRKKAQDPVTDRKGTGGAPRPVSNNIGEAAFHLTKKSLLRNIDHLTTNLANTLVKQLFGNDYSADEINGRKRILKRMSSWASPVKVAIGATWKDAISQISGQKYPLFTTRDLDTDMTSLHEKNVPTDPELWSRAKAEAKKRFDVYPSAYANGWASKWYKEHGGGWSSESNEENTPTDREWGTDSLTDIYKKDTPGQLEELFTELLSLSEAWEKITKCQQCKKSLSSREQKLGFRICDKCVGKNKGGVWGKDSDDDYVDEDCGCGAPAKVEDSLTEATFKAEIEFSGKDVRGNWQTKKTLYSVQAVSRKHALNKAVEYAMRLHDYDNLDQQDAPSLEVRIVESLSEDSEYQGRKVTLGKPFRTPDGPKKFSVYVRNDKGNVVKVNFGDPNLSIKRDDPGRRKNFRARHGCDDPGPRWKAKYWSCRFWSKKPVSKMT